MSWPLALLGDLFEIARGGSPRPIQEFITDAPDGVNWISISDATESGKYIARTKLKIRPEGVSRSRVVNPGDFLLTNSMSFGRPYIMATSGCIHDGWLVLSDRRGLVDQGYFYHLLGSRLVYNEFSRLAAGSVVKNLNIGLVSGVKVPLPPLAEQRRIAGILDEADAQHRKRERALGLLEDLQRSVFLDMFGDPVGNPKGLPTIPLGDIIVDGPTNGLYRPSTDYGTGTPIVRIDSFRGGQITDLSSLKRVNIEDDVVAKYSLAPGQVLVNRVNAPDHLGKAAIVPLLAEATVFESNMMRFTLDEGRILPLFAVTQMESAWVKRQIASRRKDAVNQSSINQDDLRSIQLRMPPLDLQHRFVEWVCDVRRLRATQANGLERLENLKASLLSQVLEGPF